MTGQIPPGPVGNAGVPLPILDSFAFDTWMILPKSRSPNGISLRIRNRENCVIERHNEESCFQTVLCREDRVNHPDVGLPVKGMYDYLRHEWLTMARSNDLLKQVGPVPAFVQVGLDKIKEGDKLKGVAGSMVINNPITRSPGQRPLPAVPKIICQTLACRIKVPLHYFFDSNLESANFNIANLHTKMLAPEPSSDNPSPHKVLIFDMAKMSEIWGDDLSPSVFTPLRWQQASKNLLRTLNIMSEDAKKTTRPTFAGEYTKHLDFFLNVPDFEEDFVDIYPFERKARQELLNGTLFDAPYYTTRVNSIIDAKRAAILAAQALSPKRSFPDSSSDTRPSKSCRIQSSPSKPLTSSFPAVCICCAGPHKLKDHPTSVTTFQDGKSLFSIVRDNNLIVVKTGKTICILFNLSWGCATPRHGNERVHVCSLCGGNHAALSMHPDCGRVGDGRHRS